MNKKITHLLIPHTWFLIAVVFLSLGIVQRNQMWLIFGFADITFACSSYAIGGQKKGDKNREDNGHGKKS